MVDMTPELKAELKSRLDEIMEELAAAEEEFEKAAQKESEEMEPAAREKFEEVKKKFLKVKTDIETMVEKMREMGYEV